MPSKYKVGEMVKLIDSLSVDNPFHTNWSVGVDKMGFRPHKILEAVPVGGYDDNFPPYYYTFMKNHSGVWENLLERPKTSNEERIKKRMEEVKNA